MQAVQPCACLLTSIYIYACHAADNYTSNLARLAVLAGTLNRNCECLEQCPANQTAMHSQSAVLLCLADLEYHATVSIAT